MDFAYGYSIRCRTLSCLYADIWLANQTVKQKLLQADIVIQFGSRFISKRINQFLAEFKANFGWWSKVKMQLIQTTIRKSRFNAKAHHWLRAHPPLRQKPWLLEPLALSKFCATLYRTTSRWQS